MRTPVLLLAFILPILLQAQLIVPPSSVPATIKTQIGLTNFTITYHRPSVKGRVIFGELLPYGEVWRTGANQATRIQFDQPIQIAGQTVEAGTYAIYTIPRAIDEWTFILNTDTTLWGARGYDESEDVLRTDLPVRGLPERIETMEFRWMDITHTSAKLCLEWENVRLSVPINLNTTEQVNASIEKELTANNTNGGDYYSAARYYLDNSLDLAQAKAWMDKRIELDGEQFGVMRYQAIIERKLGNLEEAKRIMQRSLELAEERPNPHYVRMNTKTLKEWNKVAMTWITAEELLDRSIKYHDPVGHGAKHGIELKLYESRPGGNYRISDLMIDNKTGIFELSQRRGKNHIYREYDPVMNTGCDHLLNASENYTEEEAKEFRLDCKTTQFYRNYYAYLWGLPMKLKDPGTIIDPSVHRVDFFGQELLEIRVTYDQEIGDDIWYFYFHPDTYALSGYRFYHDEAANDGEYILLEDEVTFDTVKIPAKRHWYTHKDRRYLGSDEIIGF